MQRNSRPLLLVLLSGLAVVATFVTMPSASASSPGWLNKCGYVRSLSDDPIVYPAKPGASHLHDFLGNKSTDAFSTLSSMKAAGTSCTLATDTAGYWAPALYRNGTRVKPAGSVNGHSTRQQIYYRDNNLAAGTHINTIPADLRLVAGQGHAESPAENPKHRQADRPAVVVRQWHHHVAHRLPQLLGRGPDARERQHARRLPELVQVPGGLPEGAAPGDRPVRVPRRHDDREDHLVERPDVHDPRRLLEHLEPGPPGPARHRVPEHGQGLRYAHKLTYFGRPTTASDGGTLPSCGLDFRYDSRHGHLPGSDPRDRGSPCVVDT
jgi:hypothetical protein